MIGPIKQLAKEIREAHEFLRLRNNTIPSETLQFMLDASLEKLGELEEETTPTPDYEYELRIDGEEGTTFRLNGWIPIATDRIKDRKYLQDYIDRGIIRKIKNDE